MDGDATIMLRTFATLAVAGMRFDGS